MTGTERIAKELERMKLNSDPLLLGDAETVVAGILDPDPPETMENTLLFAEARSKPEIQRLVTAGALIAHALDEKLKDQAPDPPPTPSPTHTKNHVPKPGKRVRIKESLHEDLIQAGTDHGLADHMATMSGMYGRIERLNDEAGMASVTLDGKGTITEIPIRSLEILN